MREQPKNRLLDSVEALEPWVEKGRAPDRIVGAHFAGGPHIAKQPHACPCARILKSRSARAQAARTRLPGLQEWRAGLIHAAKGLSASAIPPDEEVRDILRNAVNEHDTAAGGLGTEIASLFAKVGLDEDIVELRGHKIKPASFAR